MPQQIKTGGILKSVEQKRRFKDTNLEHDGIATGISFLIDQSHQKNISSSRPLNFPPKLSLSSITQPIIQNLTNVLNKTHLNSQRIAY